MQCLQTQIASRLFNDDFNSRLVFSGQAFGHEELKGPCLLNMHLEFSDDLSSSTDMLVPSNNSWISSVFVMSEIIDTNSSAVFWPMTFVRSSLLAGCSECLKKKKIDL